MEWSLYRHCDQEHGCHCDWRLSVHGCEESHAMQIVYIVNIAYSALVAIGGLGILYNRCVLKGRRFFEINSGKGCLRPKPIECMILLLTIFNLFRLTSAVILVWDVAPNNMMLRSWLFEFPWYFGYGGFALYLLGIAQTLADSHKAISEGWLPSPLTVDIVGCTIFLAPPILHTPVVLVSGALAAGGNEHAAQALVRVQYSLWTLHCCVLSSAVMFSGIRLVRILNGHLTKFQVGSPRYSAIKNGIFKINAVMGIITLCLMLFAAQCLLYAILRDQIMTSTAGSIALAVIWTYLGPAAIFCVELAIIFNPSKSPFLRLGASTKSSSEEKSSNVYETDYTSTFQQHQQHQESTIPGTLSRNAFDELKQTRIEKKHNETFQLRSIDDTHEPHQRHHTHPQHSFPEDNEEQHRKSSSQASLVYN
ncbi:hypothetical protein BCR43DRAFT_497671 [Syncephalastrum racemosum]|uniref:THH1/TOM1/TOM3 domain-containing protein n=1 Tax=Syncephalastrum racemosum TaxID=13706 RepID=A0A1X2H2J3_SYNRA|nr:hypothetical protein BCR43DRAFT_497671 [Syncephalastrum racemosum]